MLCTPMHVSVPVSMPVLSLPTLAFRSPRTTSMSCFGVQCNTLKSAVKIILFILTCLICWWIALNNTELDVFWVKPCMCQSVIHWVPFYQSLWCLLIIAASPLSWSWSFPEYMMISLLLQVIFAEPVWHDSLVSSISMLYCLISFTTCAVKRVTSSTVLQLFNNSASSWWMVISP